LLLKNAEIETRPIVGSNLTKQPFISDSNYDQSMFPNVNVLHNQGIYVGNNQFVTIERVDELLNILECIR
jgi:CDP-6-deoxy-D-xylo-4-hexulose-3-dehydrase